MYEKLVRQGNAVYEIDEECIRRKERAERRQAEREKPPERKKLQK